MYKYLSRATFRSCMASGKFPRVNENVQSSQAFSRDFCLLIMLKKPEIRHAQVQIINALQLGQRKKAQEMLVDLSCMNESSNADDFDYIWEYCARIPDPLFIMQAWKTLVKNGIYMKKKSFRCIIEAFCKGGYFKEAFEWLNSLEEINDFQASLPLCNIVLRECVNKQRLFDVGRCLELMDNHLLGRSEITYWELLKHSVLQKSLSTVHDIWKDCIKHYNPSVIILRKFVWSFTKLHDLESAYRVLQFMVSHAKDNCDPLKKSSAGRYHSSRFDFPVPPTSELSDIGLKLNEKEKYTCSPIDSSTVGGGGSNSQYLLVKKDEMVEHFTKCLRNKAFDCLPKEAVSIKVANALRWSFNDLIQCCNLSGKWELAELLFLQMQNFGIEPSSRTYDGLIKAVVHGRSLACGLKLMESMEINGMKPCNDTLANLSIEYSKNFEIDMAERLLERISDDHPKYIHPFNAFLVACDTMDELERAVHVLAKLKRLNIRPNIRTFEVLFSLFGNVNAPYERGNWPSHLHAAERIRHIEMGMRKNSIQHSYTSMKNLIRALGIEGMIPEMLQRLENAEKLLLATEPHQITDLYNIVLHALVEAGHSHTVMKYFIRMRTYGFPADAATYHIMLEWCSLITSFRSALALTSLMLRDGFFPQIMTYTTLVKVLLATDDFHGALDVFSQASREIRLDVHLFNEILQRACTKISEEEHAKGLIDVVEHVLEQMLRRKIKPDPSTCAHAFAAYAELGFHSTAVEVLRVLSLRMIFGNGNDLQEKRSGFEDLVCSEDPDVESKIVSVFKGGEEYIAMGLLNLRLCTLIVGHPLSWSPEESLWAQRLLSSNSSRKGDV